MLEEAVAAIFQTPGHDAHRRFWVSALLPYLFVLLLMVSLFFITLLTATLDVLDEQPLGVFALGRPLAYGIKLLVRLSGFLGGSVPLIPGSTVSFRWSGSRSDARWSAALAAAMLWRLTAVFMVYFFTNISMVNVLYGSLATVIVVLLSLRSSSSSSCSARRSSPSSRQASPRDYGGTKSRPSAARCRRTHRVTRRATCSPGAGAVQVASTSAEGSGSLFLCASARRIVTISAITTCAAAATGIPTTAPMTAMNSTRNRMASRVTSGLTCAVRR